MNILEKLRAQVIAWVNVATLDQIGSLPSEVLEFSTTEARPNSKVDVPSSRRRRIPKKMQKPMTRTDADMIREAMSGLDKSSIAYRKKQDDLCREHGFCRRQIGAAVSGLHRAAKRVATQKKSKIIRK